VSAVFPGNNLQSISELFLEFQQNAPGIVERTVVDRKNDEILGPALNFEKSLGYHFTDGRLLVEHRHHNHYIGNTILIVHRDNGNEISF